MNVKDQVNNTTVVEGQLTAFKVLEGIQQEKPGKVLVGIAMMFLMYCERFKVKPREVLDVANRVLYDSLSVGRGEHTRAVKTYMNMEL